MFPDSPDFAIVPVLEALRSGGVLSPEITSIEEVKGGFSGAGVWRIKTMTGSVALRRWPQPGLSQERLEGLHAFLRWLPTQEFPLIPVPLKNRLGETLFRVSSGLWQVEPWREGEADFHQNPSVGRLKSIMSSLARFHLIAGRYSAPAASREWFQSKSADQAPGVIERGAILSTWTSEKWEQVRLGLSQMRGTMFAAWGEAVLPRAWPVIGTLREELRSAKSFRVPLVPCLRDLWHDHLLFTGETLTGIIDPGACRVECVASDLTRLLGSLFGDDKQQWSVALDEYSRLRRLTPEEENLLLIYDRSQVLVSCLTWLEWICLEGRPVPSGAGFERRLEGLLQRLERLRQTC